MIDIIEFVSLFGQTGTMVPPVPIPDAGMNFLEALRNRVKSVCPELGEGVYLASADPGAEVPFVIINKLWEDTIETSIPGEDYKEVRLQFTLFSYSDTEAESLGKKVFKGLKPHPTRPALSFDDGYEMGRHPGRLTGPTDAMDDPMGDQKVWRVMFDFTWDIGMNEDD